MLRKYLCYNHKTKYSYKDIDSILYLSRAELYYYADYCADIIYSYPVILKYNNINKEESHGVFLLTSNTYIVGRIKDRDDYSYFKNIKWSNYLEKSKIDIDNKTILNSRAINYDLRELRFNKYKERLNG